MAISSVTISNHPITGLARIVDVVALNITSDAIVLVQEVYQLNSSGVRITNESLAPMDIISYATNNTLVDPANGFYVESDGNGGWIYDGSIGGSAPANGTPFTGTPVPEYAFLIAMLNTPVNIQGMITQYIKLNDSLGDYNV